MSVGAAKPEAHRIEKSHRAEPEIANLLQLAVHLRSGVAVAAYLHQTYLDGRLLMEKSMDRIDVISVRSFAVLDLPCQVAKVPAHGDAGQWVGRAIVDALGPNRSRFAHSHFHEAARNAVVWIESRREVPILPAVVVMFDGPDESGKRGERGEMLVSPNAGQFAGKAGVFDLRDDEPVAMIIAADQGYAPALNDRPVFAGYRTWVESLSWLTR